MGAVCLHIIEQANSITREQQCLSGAVLADEPGESRQGSRAAPRRLTEYDKSVIPLLLWLHLIDGRLTHKETRAFYQTGSLIKVVRS